MKRTVLIAFLISIAMCALAQIVIKSSSIVGQSHPASAAAPPGRDRYASGSGSSTSDGSIGAPWNMWTALNPSGGYGPIPGDTVWIRGGTYNINFDVTASGTVAQPIKYRQYPGERVIVDGGSSTYPGFTVKGSNLWFWGFEIYFSNTTRQTTQSGSDPTDIFRGMTIATDQSSSPVNLKIINMVVHDGWNNLGIWADATDAEVYGNIIYYAGWDAPDRGHGHGLYIQNPQNGTKHIEDNIMFRNSSHGLHAYSWSDLINNYVINNNIAFDNGEIAGAYFQTNYRVNGDGIDPVRNVQFTNNFAYYSPRYSGGNNVLGNAAGCTNVAITGNYFLTANGVALIKDAGCAGLTMTGNTFLGSLSGFTSGNYPSNTYYSSAPTSGIETFVRPNRYEAGRANIVVLNWAGSSTASVDVSSVLSIGDTYEVRDAQNYLGTPAVTGTYCGGTLSFPLTLTTVTAPIGNVTTQPTHTTSQFNVYVLRKTGTGSCS